MFREAERSTPIMAADRSTFSRRAILCLFVLIGIPSAVRPSTLEDSAKELAAKIASFLHARENVSCEIRNLSSLQTQDVARVEAAIKNEWQDRGIRVSDNDATSAIVVTLSENFKNLVWTGEIHQGDTSHVVMIAVAHSSESRVFSNAMPVTIRSERFWEGPERILDAGEIAGIGGKPWIVLLLPDKLQIQEPTGRIEINFPSTASRDPWGVLNLGLAGNTIGVYVPPRMCILNLDTQSLSECEPTDERPVLLIDLAPPGPPPGKGTEIVMGSVCGGTSQFLATGARDYTQTDSLQVFQTESSGTAAVSIEVGFPGPITGLHAVSDTPRAVVKNLATGNYEAYHLSFSCGR